MKTSDSQYFEWFNQLFTGVVVLSALIVWVVFGALYKESDTITLFTMDRTAPDVRDIMAGVIPDSAMGPQRKKAEIGLLDFCVMPRLYTFLQTLADASKYVNDNQASGVGKTDIWGYVSRSSPAWRSHTPNGTVVLNHFNLPYDVPGDLYTKTAGTPNLPPQHFLPVCRCITKVLDKSETLTDPPAVTVQKTRDAMSSCVYTRQLIPRQKFVVGSATEQKQANTKVMSRSGFLVMLALAVLMNMLLKSWNLDVKPEFLDRLTDQLVKKLMYLAILFATFFMPGAFMLGNAGYLTYTSTIVLVGFAVMAIVEIAWLSEGQEYLEDAKKQTYIHPFPFYITLVSLYMLALIENGVYTDENIFTYIWSSLAISCLYTGVLICERRKLWYSEIFGEATQVGFLMYLFLAGLVITVRLTPYFPYTGDLNFLWTLPQSFAAFCFAGVVFLERVVDEDDQKEPKKSFFTESAHYTQLGHTAILMLVLFYFVSILVILAMNDRILIAANSVMNRLNFEVYQFSNKAYVGF